MIYDEHLIKKLIINLELKVIWYFFPFHWDMNEKKKKKKKKKARRIFLHDAAECTSLFLFLSHWNGKKRTFNS